MFHSIYYGKIWIIKNISTVRSDWIISNTSQCSLMLFGKIVIQKYLSSLRMTDFYTCTNWVLLELNLGCSTLSKSHQNWVHSGNLKRITIKLNSCHLCRTFYTYSIPNRWISVIAFENWQCSSTTIVSFFVNVR